MKLNKIFMQNYLLILNSIYVLYLIAIYFSRNNFDIVDFITFRKRVLIIYKIGIIEFKIFIPQCIKNDNYYINR